MSELIQNLGVDWRIMIAQIINFALLLFLLKKFAYTPLLTALNARRERIEEAIERSRQVEEKMEEIEGLKQEALGRAREESEVIIQKAEASAARVQEEILKEAHRRSEHMLKEMEKKIDAEREKIFVQAKKDIAELVAQYVEQAVGDVVDDAVRRRLVDQVTEAIGARSTQTVL